MRAAARAPVLLLPALTAALSSCETGTGSPKAGPTRETLPNGAVLVRHPGLPAIDSAGPEVIEAQVDLRFGSVDGADPNFIFGDVRGVQAASDGTIYVLDYQAVEVRVFDRDGNYLRTVTRRGEGPGEILEANGIHLSGDTLLWIHDHSQWVIMGVNPDGEEVRRFNKPVMRYGYIWEAEFDDRGRYWRSTSHSDDERSYPLESGLQTGTTRRYYKSYDLSGGAIDSVYLGEGSYRSYAYTHDRGGGVLGIPFQSGESILVNPSGGFWRANTASYRIARTNEDGDTLIVIEAGLEERPVTAADRLAYVEGIVERQPEIRRFAEEVASLMPDRKPILEELFVDDEGRLWVQRVTPDDAPAFHDLFSEDGDYLGSVRLGFEAAGPLEVRHGNIHTWVVDELGVPHVVRAPLS